MEPRDRTKSAQTHALFLHAKSFLYAADSIGKLLLVLAERSDVSEQTIRACAAFYEAFPEMREVRNSSQHLEDRVRGLGRWGKPLDLKAIDRGGIKSPSESGLVLSHLAGNRFGCTMADGHYGEVDVSAASLGAMRDLVEAMLETLPWTGPSTIEPRP